MDELEEWRSIDGFSKYQVSSFGRVKALARVFTDVKGRIFHLKERILAQSTHHYTRHNSLYYNKVKIINDKGVVCNVLLHRLVATAFLPNPNNLPEVNHINLNKSDNRLCNLEWVTKKENSERCIQRPHNGDTNGNSKLTSEIVLWCRELRNNGLSYNRIANMVYDNYNIRVSDVQISNVINKQWQHL